ncbi:hypothetical protein SAMN05216201_11856 [Pseudomonas linyingensis]|uniref:Uncharacterized protein n=1 Tax=Pseudomonas linyingensis TaxID=915471 RepID=A0A1H7BPF5_9PSED|nr:hypothetical protein [Pseudomonas linyingensis]SEJ79449.1 hypothetical protein SAMN05216201_11856 [Pseudomonas linyingensis]
MNSPANLSREAALRIALATRAPVADDPLPHARPHDHDDRRGRPGAR